MWCKGTGKASPTSAATEPRELNGTNKTRELFRTIQDAAVRESATNSWPWTLAPGVIVGGSISEPQNGQRLSVLMEAIKETLAETSAREIIARWLREDRHPNLTRR